MNDNTHSESKKSIFRICIHTVFSSCIGSFIAIVITFFPVGILLAPFSIFAGLYYAWPLIFLACPINFILDRKGLTQKKYLIPIATTCSFLYGLVLFAYFNMPALIILTTSIGGFFSSWAYWREMYANMKGFRIFRT